MLNVCFYNKDWERINSPGCVSLKLSMDSDVPADSLEVTLPYFDTYKDVSRVSVFDNENNRIFSGICDESELRKNQKGAFVALYFRDFTALLIDNEGIPCEFINPTADVIFEKYLAPLGFDSFIADGKAVNGKFTVKKGTSVYKILSDFCSINYGCKPAVLPDGKIIFTGVNPAEKVIFSDSSDYQFFTYTSITANSYPCKVISSVRIKTSSDDFYNTIIKNNLGDKTGVIRERCVDACCASTPAETAFRIIENTNSQYEEYKIRTESIRSFSVFQSAEIKDSCLGNITKLYVSALAIVQEPDSEYCDITLKRRIQMWLIDYITKQNAGDYANKGEVSSADSQTVSVVSSNLLRSVKQVFPYGVISVPPSEESAVVIPLKGENVAVGTFAEKRDIKPGELLLYSQGGAEIYLCNNGKVYINGVEY